LKDSRIAGLHRKTVEERIRVLTDLGFLAPDMAMLLSRGEACLPIAHAERMIENTVGVFGLPLGIAPNFLVNNKDYIVPMVVEEPSIVAGVSGAAKLFRESGGFLVDSAEQLLIGQIQIVEVEDPDETIELLQSSADKLLDLANESQPRLQARGGGTRSLEFHKHQLPGGQWTVVLHLLVDTCDAMGANSVNTLCEALAPQVEKISGCKVSLRILSNLADRSLVTARGKIALSSLGDRQDAEAVRDAIVQANDFANVDPYRAATHNKGIMNGIDALAIATGNDWRAIEAGAHVFAVRDGSYRALTSWSVDENGNLCGVLTMPLKPGIVGGSLSANPGAGIGLALCGVSSAKELAALMAATGLAQNFAALRALVSDGIQKGHMRLHARSVATSAEVADDIFDAVVSGMIESGEVKTWKARELAENLRAGQVARSLPPESDLAQGSAAGKVILLGEHAVVYDKHALALPIADAVVATVQEGPPGVRLSIAGWGIEETWLPGEQNLRGAAAVVALVVDELVVDELGAGDSGLHIQVGARIPIGMGLGASAAFAVAVIRAFNVFLDKGIDNDAIDALAFRCERITHGTPSGIDNRIATFSEPLLFNKVGTAHCRAIDLVEIPPLVVAVSSRRGSTKDMVAGVRLRHDSNRNLYQSIFDEIDDISLNGAEALEKRNYAELGILMNVCHGLLNAIEVSTPELERMIGVARDAGAVGAKVTGAGGGGSVVALCPGTVREVTSALDAAGFSTIHLAES